MVTEFSEEGSPCFPDEGTGGEGEEQTPFTNVI